MRKADASEIDGPQDGRRPRAARWRVIAIGVAAAALVGGGTAWLSRERIAADVIDDYLAESGVHATYIIISLTPSQQVIENLVVGDPARPDLTVRRLVISLGAGWAGPEVRNVRVEGARVFASYKGDAFSLGALDPLVFTGSDAALRLPAIDVTIRDARALLASDYGRVGLTLDGAGRLDDGFADRDGRLPRGQRHAVWPAYHRCGRARTEWTAASRRRGLRRCQPYTGGYRHACQPEA